MPVANLSSGREHAKLLSRLAPAIARLAASDELLLATQIAVSEIPAPTGDERRGPEQRREPGNLHSEEHLLNEPGGPNKERSVRGFGQVWIHGIVGSAGESVGSGS